MAKRIRSGRVTITTVGSPKQLLEESESFRALHVDVYPFTANTTAIAVGGQDVRATAAVESGYIMTGTDSYSEDDVDMSAIWVDAITANEGARWIATYDDEQ